jgi:hypothetical protein
MGFDKERGGERSSLLGELLSCGDCMIFPHSCSVRDIDLIGLGFPEKAKRRQVIASFLCTKAHFGAICGIEGVSDRDGEEVKIEYGCVEAQRNKNFPQRRKDAKKNKSFPAETRRRRGTRDVRGHLHSLLFVHL